MRTCDKQATTPSHISSEGRGFRGMVVDRSSLPLQLAYSTSAYKTSPWGHRRLDYIKLPFYCVFVH